MKQINLNAVLLRRMPRRGQDIIHELRIGLAHHQSGQLDSAEIFYRGVLQKVPNQPDALNLLGVIAQDRGRPARAVELISRAVRARPKFPEALTNLARAQRAAGDAQSAAASARRAIKLAPQMAEAHLQLGRALLDLEENAAAVEACRRAAELAPALLDAHVNLGAALTRLEDFPAAAEAYQTAHKLRPDRAETLTDFAGVLGQMERYEDALRCHQRAVALAPNDPRTHAGMAATLKQAQDVTGSVAACRRTLELEPDNTRVMLLLAGNFAALGDFSAAIATYRQVLALDPDSTEARRGVVVVGGQVDGAERSQLHAVLNDPQAPAERRVAAGFALGNLLDKAGEYDDAFHAFATANPVTREEREAADKGFDRRALVEHVDAMIAAFGRETFDRVYGLGTPSELPVFIVGMPRSGTTLVEQIVASHPAGFGAGERKDIGRILKELGADANPAPESWDRALIASLAPAHIERLREMGGQALRVADKMPDNIFWLGLIAVLFPGARVIICRRDLRDVCLSCHFQHFSAGLAWTNDLSDCAFRAQQVERLRRHWNAVLPLPLLEVHYEKLVQEPERESRRLIEFLDLPWDPACLEFHRTERAVLTASLWQVRQPLYAHSVHRWQRYRVHLGPLIEGLGQQWQAEQVGSLEGAA